jgi:hypothetical protein
MDKSQEFAEIVKAAGKVVQEEHVSPLTDDMINRIDKEFDVMPGQAVTPNTDIDFKKEANNKILMQAAFDKVKKERDEFLKKSENEKIRQYVIHHTIQHNEHDYRMKYGYEMSGKQKRTLRKLVERKYDSGKIKLKPEERMNILAEINKFSNSVKKAVNTNDKL